MFRRDRARALLGVIALCVALVAPSAAWATPTDPAQTPTNTTLTIDPQTSHAGTETRLVAQVTPLPEAGYVEFFGWDAPSGGTPLWTHREKLEANGRVVLPDVTLSPGSYWVDAVFTGSAYFAPSTSARVAMTVVPKTPTVTLTLNATQLVAGQDVGFSFTLAPSEAAYGYVELVIDGGVYASLLVQPSSPRSYQLPGTLGPGIHEVKLRLRSSAWDYGDGETATQTLRVGDVAIPAAGVRIDHDRFSTPDRQVGVSVASNDPPGSPAATHVRFSNDSSLADGLLMNGETFERSDDPMPWTLAAGPDGVRTVYVQWRRGDGSWSAPLSDDIYLDTTAPTGSFVINDGDARVGDLWSGTMYEQRLRWSASDASVGPSGGAITQLAVSNDGEEWWTRPFIGDPADHTTMWQIVSSWGASQNTSPCGSDDLARTVYMKWRDAAGNWSPVAMDTIDVYWDNSVARVLIDGDYGYRCGGSEYVSTAAVVLTFQIRDMPSEGLDRIRIRGEWGASWKTIPWRDGLAVEWSLINSTYGYTTGDGIKNVHVELITKTGRKRTFGDLVILDRVVPTSTAPKPTFALNSVVDQVTAADGSGLTAASTNTAVAADVRWSGKDGGEVSSHRLQRSVNAGSWTTVSLAQPTIPTARQVLQQGNKFRYRARTIDTAGNAGAWKAGPEFGFSVHQESASSIVYKGFWQTAPRDDALGGQLRMSRTAGASAKYTFTGRGVAWIAPRSVDGDTVDVYVDGVKVKTVHLSLSAGYHPRRIVFSMSWKAVGTHTIRIVKKYDNGYELPIDAFMVLK